MKNIKAALLAVKTGVLIMAFSHFVLLVVLAIRDNDLSRINIIAIMDLQHFWPGLLNWEMGFWFFWLIFFLFLGFIWWLGEKKNP